MKKLLQPQLLVKKSSVHGYGVFADKDFLENDIIEECYSILCDGADTVLNKIYFDVDGQHALLTGYGSIYNHSDSPNMRYYFDEMHKVTVFIATRNIKQGEELFHSYGKYWFSSRNMPVKKTPLWVRSMRYAKGIPARFALVLSGIYLIIYTMHALIIPL